MDGKPLHMLQAKFDEFLEDIMALLASPWATIRSMSTRKLLLVSLCLAVILPLLPMTLFLLCLMLVVKLFLVLWVSTGRKTSHRPALKDGETEKHE